MAKSHGRVARILFGEFDLSTWFRSVESTKRAEMADATGFQATSKTFVVGLLDGSVTLEGLFDGATDAADDELSAAFGTDAAQIMSYAPNDFTIGRRVDLLQSRDVSYTVRAPLRDVAQTAADIQAEDAIRSGVSLHALSSESATGNSAGVDHGASSANGAVAHLHVTTNTRNGAVQVFVQHSSDGSSWADLITFTSITASTKTKERLSVAGTVNRHLRERRTVAGSTGAVTFAVACARL